MRENTSSVVRDFLALDIWHRHLGDVHNTIVTGDESPERINPGIECDRDEARAVSVLRRTRHHVIMTVLSKLLPTQTLR